MSGLPYGTSIIRHQLPELIPVTQDALAELVENGVVVGHEGHVACLKPYYDALVAPEKNVYQPNPGPRRD